MCSWCNATVGDVLILLFILKSNPRVVIRFRMLESSTYQTGRLGQRACLQTDVACLDRDGGVSLLFVLSSFLFSRTFCVSSFSAKLLLIDVHDDLNDEHEFVNDCCKKVRILSYNNSSIHLVYTGSS